MTATKGKLGILTVGRKRPGFDQEWNQIMRGKARQALGGVEEHVIADEQSTVSALEQFRTSGCTALVILQPSIGSGQLAMTVAQRWNGPLVLWATPERPDGEKVSSCSLVGQHLWASIFRQLNRPFEFVYGDPDDASVRQALAQAAAVRTSHTGLQTARVGLLGSHAPGFLTLDADPFALQSQLGVQLQRLSLMQFFERAAAIDQAAVRDDMQRVASLNLPMRDVTNDDLPLNSRYYLAIRDLMAEEALDALAIQDWPEFAHAGHWPYLAMSRLSDEGLVVTMEGDVDGAVLSYSGLAVGAGIGFVTDWLEHDDRTIHFWHAGMAALSWCDNPRLGRHFNIDKPLVVDGELRINHPMTIARLWRCDGRYFAMAFEGQTIANPRKLTGNTALVEVDAETIPTAGVREWFQSLLNAGLPHHVLLFRGRHRELLRRLMGTMRVKWIG